MSSLDRPNRLIRLNWNGFSADRWSKRQCRRWVLVLLAVAAVYKEGSIYSLTGVFLLLYNGLLSYRLCLYRGLVLGKAGVVRRLVYMELHIRVGVGSTRVRILGGRKTRWGKGSCRRQ